MKASPKATAQGAWLLAALAVAFALALFLFGLSYPFELRVRGDAAIYLRIAAQFTDWSSVASYAGDRTIGLPLFEYLVRNEHDLQAWVATVCALLFFIHLCASALFARFCLRANVVQSPALAMGLFAFLASYPALIGHTTTPLTDTFAVDIILCAIAALAASLTDSSVSRRVTLGAAAGAAAAYAILLRPAFLAGVVFATASTALALIYYRRKAAAALVASLLAAACVLYLPLRNCNARHGQLCLQAPATFDPVWHAQMGLRGARLLWWQQPSDSHEYPVLTDEFTYSHFYLPCRLTSIAGWSDQSLTGCLLRRPLATPVLVIKKWIGLFDHFRFTPYIEAQTPGWLRALSRCYDSAAWIGLFFSFAALLALVRRARREQSLAFVAGNLPLLFLGAFSLATLAQQTALHVEDRFSLPLVPICAVALARKVEALSAAAPAQRTRPLRRALLYSLACWVPFILQLIAWDGMPFR